MNRERYEFLVEKVLKVKDIASRVNIQNYEDAQTRRYLGQFLISIEEYREALEVLHSIFEDFEEIEEENHVWILMLIAELYAMNIEHKDEAFEYAIKAIDIAKNQRGEYMVLEKDEIINHMEAVIARVTEEIEE